MEFVLRQGYVRLGILRVVEADQPWFKCVFEVTPSPQDTLPLFVHAPTPAFESIRPLFEEAYRLWEQDWEQDTDYATWEVAYARIEELGLSLTAPNGAYDILDFVLLIKDQEAWLRY